MKAYGSRGKWDIEDYGEPSRIRKMKSKNRRELRRMFHKRGRRDAKKEIDNERCDES